MYVFPHQISRSKMRIVCPQNSTIFQNMSQRIDFYHTWSLDSTWEKSVYKKHTRSLFLKTISNIPITKCSSRACFFLRWKMYLHYRYDRLRELTKVAKLLLPFSHVIIRAVNWNCARECICIEQRPINPIILWFFNHSSSIRWLPRQIELTKIPVLASSKIQPDLPAG